jgi:hypothetical protein
MGRSVSRLAESRTSLLTSDNDIGTSLRVDWIGGVEVVSVESIVSTHSVALPVAPTSLRRAPVYSPLHGIVLVDEGDRDNHELRRDVRLLAGRVVYDFIACFSGYSPRSICGAPTMDQ